MVMPKTIKGTGSARQGSPACAHGQEDGGYGQAQGAGQAIEFGLGAALPVAHVHAAEREHGEDHQQDGGAAAEAVPELAFLEKCLVFQPEQLELVRVDRFARLDQRIARQVGGHRGLDPLAALLLGLLARFRIDRERGQRLGRIMQPGLQPGVNAVGDGLRAEPVDQRLPDRLGINPHFTDFNVAPRRRMLDRVGLLDRVDRDRLLVETAEIPREVGQQSIFLQGGECRSHRAIELIELLVAGQGLAELLECGQIRRGLGLLDRLFRRFRSRFRLLNGLFRPIRRGLGLLGGLFRQREEFLPHRAGLFRQRFRLGELGDRVAQFGPQLLQRFDVLGENGLGFFAGLEPGLLGLTLILLFEVHPRRDVPRGHHARPPMDGRVPGVDDQAHRGGGHQGQGDARQDVAMAESEPRLLPAPRGQLQRRYALGPSSSLTAVGHAL